MASLRELSPREKQIRDINRRVERLDGERLKSFRSLVYQAYENESIVGQVALISEVFDQQSPGYRVISASETRSLAQFNDPSYLWNSYCFELGRAVALEERAYIFETLTSTAPRSAHTVSSSSPDFRVLNEAAAELRSRGFRPDVLCAPIELMVEFLGQMSAHITWGSHPREVLTLPGDINLRVFWSSQSRPLDRFILLDSSAALWSVKPDPDTGHRLTVAIGEPPSGPENSVLWLAETVARFGVSNTNALIAIPLV